MNQVGQGANQRVFAGMVDSSRGIERAGFRIGLIAVATLLFLAMWQMPALQPLRGDADWFPVWLHTVTESVSIVISVMVFSVSWHAWRPERPGNVVILACAFLATGLLDFAHMMSYRGMPDFITAAEPQKAIAFWLSARLILALAVLCIAFRSWHPFAQARTRYVWLGGALALVSAVYAAQLGWPHLWPRFFIDGSGLTSIKIGIEASCVLILAVVAARLWQARQIEPPYDVAGMLTAALLMILAELCFTLYSNVNDVFSLLGHVYKVIAYLLVYQLAFVASVREPYERLALEIERKQAAEARVEVLAFYDLLTELPNKALLRDRLNQILAARQVDHGRAALLLVNADGFKSINDSLGHDYGDALLRAMAERLPRCLDESDTVARVGGDEFALVLREVQDAQAVAALQERVMATLAEPLTVYGQELRVTASIGIALSPTDGNSFDALFQNASTALHKAKEAGGNSWRFYDAGMNEEVSARLQLRNGLRQALARGEFELYYQPQFDLAGGALVGVEALLRWRHAEQGLVAPGKFIPEAEHSGLIVPIGNWILREACAQMRRWRDAGLAVPLVAVNLSALQFQRGDIERSVLDALTAAGLPPAALELELTESILIQDADGVLSTLRKLKTLGVTLSIDDFGTGYSSLAYLRHFPIDKLKIDQSFVRDLGQVADGEVIVRTIIQLAHSLRLETIAEGVEDARAAAILQRLGCGQVQGFHYARPMPAEALAGFLDATSSGEPR